MAFDKSAWQKAYQAKHPEIYRAASARYRKRNPDKIRKAWKDWQSRNLERRRKINREHMRQWNRENRGLAAQRKREYYARDPERIKAQWRRAAARRKLDPNKKILGDLRKAMHRALKRHSNKKFSRTVDILGCSIPSFRMYLESKFEPGMNWRNYGRRGWHIDHIMPCAIFDLSKPEHQKRCFHFSNLQPLGI